MQYISKSSKFSKSPVSQIPSERISTTITTDTLKKKSKQTHPILNTTQRQAFAVPSFRQQKNLSNEETLSTNSGLNQQSANRSQIIPNVPK